MPGKFEQIANELVIMRENKWLCLSDRQKSRPLQQGLDCIYLESRPFHRAKAGMIDRRLDRSCAPTDVGEDRRAGLEKIL